MQPPVTHLGNVIFMLIHDSAVGMTYEWWVILLRIVQFAVNRKRVSSPCIKSRRLEHICGALMSRRSERSCFMHIRKPRRCITTADGSAAHGCRKSPNSWHGGVTESRCAAVLEKEVLVWNPLTVKIKEAKQSTAAKGANRMKRGSNRSVNPPSENPLRRWVTGKIWAALYVNPLNSTSASAASEQQDTVALPLT